MSKLPFDKEEKRRELAQRLCEIEGVYIPDDALSKRPSFGLEVLAANDALEKFLNTFDWVLK